MSIEAPWFEVFRTGRHTDSAGNTREWTEADLAAIAAGYDPARHEAPIVLGHPAHDAPAYGWIEALKAEGGTLLAKPKQLAAALVQWVKDGTYKKVSIALYPDLTLRHVGFLGAMPPAVKGLAQAAFADAGRAWAEVDRGPVSAEGREKGGHPMREFLEKLKALITGVEGDPIGPIGPITYSEAEVVAREQAAVAAAVADAEAQAVRAVRAQGVHARVTQFVEAGIQAGTFLPAWAEAGIPQVLEQALLADTVVAFAEGQPPKPVGEILMQVFQSLPRIVPLGEVAASGGPGGSDAAARAAFAQHQALHEQLGVTFEQFMARRAA